MDTLYRVCWRWRTARNSVVRDYHAPDLQTLLKMLARSENVTVGTVAEMIVHQINTDGTVTELISKADQTTEKSLDELELDRLVAKGRELQRTPPAEEVVTNSLERIRQAILDGRNGANTAKDKPRIRLVHKQEPTKHYSANGMYYAVAATK